MTPNPILILASGSPRRRELLAQAGWQFSVLPANIDETPLPGEAPSEYVLRLSESKARAAVALPGAPKTGLFLAADTTVADGSELLGKPQDGREAAAMLARLRGRAHQVFTALALVDPSEGCLRTALSRTEVWMRAYSDAEIAEYVSSGDPLDKAGAYAIQHTGFHPVERIAGCYANVVGLPLCRLAQLTGSNAANEDYRNCPYCQKLMRTEE